jgi:hypothetical protein
MRYHKSTPQRLNELTDASSWGCFVRFIELADDNFALRQVDEYENGYLTCYDRKHWQDQFGMLADFRYGKLCKKHWGQPDVITREEFERKWQQAARSAPFAMRDPSPDFPAPWITLFESGRWKGQA